MKIISFKNGDKIKVHDSIVRKLYEQTVKNNQGAKQFQFFIEESNMEIIMAVNIEEISAISGQENII